MDEQHSIITFLKFGEESHIYDLFNNGTIYMNPIHKFKKTEDDKLRGDKYEGVTQIWNLPPGQFEIKSIGIKVNYNKLHFFESYQNILGNIYSLCCISSHGFSDPKIDKRVKCFGSHFLMITDCVQFKSRLINSLNATGFKYRCGFVKYYNKDIVNEYINVFQKPDDFEYQKEYRLYIERDEINPYSFKIGSLKDIAVVFPIDKIDMYL